VIGGLNAKGVSVGIYWDGSYRVSSGVGVGVRVGTLEFMWDMIISYGISRIWSFPRALRAFGRLNLSFQITECKMIGSLGFRGKENEHF